MYYEKDKIKTPYKEEADKMRTDLMNNAILPQIIEIFTFYPVLKSAIFRVSQYYNDDAYDSVHYDILFSELDEPDLLAAEKFERENKPDIINLPNIKNEYDYYDSYFDFNYSIYYDYWDSNYAVSAFACYCQDYSHQDMPDYEAFSPYALVKKSYGNKAIIKIIGKKIRPWLDGVKAEWEK